MGHGQNISRRFFLGSAGVLATWGLLGVGESVFAQTENSQAAGALSYDRLAATLYPKNRFEEEYLREIVKLVETKGLPFQIVYSSWKYAQKKSKASRIRYFGECLTILCQRAGVKFTLKTPH